MNDYGAKRPYLFKPSKLPILTKILGLKYPFLGELTASSLPEHREKKPNTENP